MTDAVIFENVDIVFGDNPERALESLLSETKHEQEALWREDARRYAVQLGREDGFDIRFDDEAIDLVLARSQEAGKTVRGYCEETDCIFLLKDNLRLMARQMAQLSRGGKDKP